jgi:hypothetical protein
VRDNARTGWVEVIESGGITAVWNGSKSMTNMSSLTLDALDPC